MNQMAVVDVISYTSILELNPLLWNTWYYIVKCIAPCGSGGWGAGDGVRIGSLQSPHRPTPTPWPSVSMATRKFEDSLVVKGDYKGPKSPFHTKMCLIPLFRLCLIYIFKQVSGALWPIRCFYSRKTCQSKNKNHNTKQNKFERVYAFLLRFIDE